MVSSRSDGTGASEHRFGETEVGPGEYFVMGSAPLESMQGHVDYSYGSTLGSLRNSEAALSIRCGETIIDRVAYANTSDGRALELDGRLIPDGEANDDASHWCFAPETAIEVSPGNFGTPGAPNSPCEEAPVEGTCDESGTRRALDQPEAGEVLITEWMANPRGADGELEWVEVLFTESADLNGIQLGAQSDSLSAPLSEDGCFPVDAGTRVVFGASPAAAARVDAELDFSLGNTADRSIVVAVENMVLDRVDYVGSEEGIAWQVDADGLLCLVDPVTADEYQDGNFGTPGQPNPQCIPSLVEGMCFDGNTPRKIRHPSAEHVQITEWMANPSVVSNRDGEWIEVHFATAVDLNDLVWSDLTGARTSIERDDCMTVPAGGFAVFARNRHADENGGLPFTHGELGISLNNTDELISIGVDGIVLDSIAYEESRSGIATQIDEQGSICDAVTPYGDGDLGTPGKPNHPCL